MLYGLVAEDNAERVDNTDGDGFKEGIYYFGGEDDGAMTVGWLQMDITYDEATDDAYKEIAPVFTDDEDVYKRQGGSRAHKNYTGMYRMQTTQL